MKILIIQENGRHDLNRNYRECFNIQRCLINFGIETEVWGLGHSNFDTSFEEISKDKDVIFLLEQYESGSWVPNLELIKKLKIFWSIDSHLDLRTHQTIVSKHKIDIVLHSVYGHENSFGDIKTYWFPNAYPNELIKPLSGIEKKWDVGFCGNINNRYSYLNLIESRFNLKKDIFVIGDEMVRSINEYKIHFNRNISYDVNYRTFETLGCKTFLLTNETPGLKYLFDIGTNIITYNDNDLIDKINYYLNNESERVHFEKMGYEHVIKNHTFLNRTKQLIDVINENI